MMEDFELLGHEAGSAVPRLRLDAASPATPTEPSEDLPEGFQSLADVAVILWSFVTAYELLPRLRHFFAPAGALGPWLTSLGVPPSYGANSVPLQVPETFGIAAVAALATVVSMNLLGGYRSLLKQSWSRVVVTSVLGPMGGLGATTVVLFGLRIDDFSRFFLFCFVGLQVFGFVVWRLALRGYKVRRFRAGHYVRDVVVIGNHAHVRRLANHFRKNVQPYSYRVTGALLVPGAHPDPADVEPLPVPVLGAVGQLGDLLIHRPIADVVVSQSSGESPWLSQVIRDCDYFRTTLRIVPEAVLSERMRDLRPAQPADPTGLPALVLVPVGAHGHPVFLKRLLDILVSATLLLLLAPFFALIALAIKLTTPGLSVFYPWRVVGYRGRVFVGYKFTTMQADADQQKEKLAHLNEMSGPVFKIKEDPRITRFGRFLRKYSINELPQLWSVLRGDMSLVGPRPAGPHELERYELWHKRKLSIMPGITCLWQVRGRNKISSFDDWVKMDLEYIDNWSLWLDLRILARTAVVVFRGTGS